MRPTFFRIRDIMVDSMKAIEQLYERKELVTGVPTGFVDLDRMTAGLQPSDLIIVAGRPSMGKTAFALNIAQYAALQRQDRRRGLLAGNVEGAAGAAPAVLRGARRSCRRCAPASPPDRDFPKLAMAAGRLSDAPIYIDDTAGAQRARAARQGAPPEARTRRRSSA